jgi:MFS family permease
MALRWAGPYAEIFAIAPFRRFGGGFALSILGDEITRVAFVWFVLQRDGSAEALALLGVAFTLPILAGGLVAGWLLDRFDRRRVMILDCLVRGGAVALVPALHLMGALEVWHVHAVAGVHGFLMMIALAGTPAVILATVPRHLLPTANALETIGYTLAGIAGPALGGLAIGAIGAPLAVLADALSYLVFAAALAGLAPAVAERGAERRPVRLGDGVALLAGHPVLASTTVMYCLFNVGAGTMAVWLPLHVERTLHGGPELYGGLMAALALGELASSLAAGAVVARLTEGLAIGLALVASGAGLLLVVVLPGAAGAGLGLLLFGAASAPLTIWAQTLRMAIVPERLRGRAFALMRTIMQGGRPIGAGLAGPLVPLLGVPLTVAAAAGVIGGAGAVGLTLPSLRRATPDSVARRD